MTTDVLLQYSTEAVPIKLVNYMYNTCIDNLLNHLKHAAETKDLSLEEADAQGKRNHGQLFHKKKIM